MSKPSDKFGIILELIDLAERAFIYKLKKKDPRLTQADIEAEVRAWYMNRPGAELGDGVGIPGDIKRFKVCGNSSK